MTEWLLPATWLLHGSAPAAWCLSEAYVSCIMQSKLIARVLSGRARLPSRVQMAQDVTDFYQVLVDRGVPVRYTHNQVSTPTPVPTWRI